MHPKLTIGQIGRLYPELAPQLERILGRHLDAPEGVVEEACQRAWGQLVAHRERVDADRALGWLATTARREALRVMRESAAVDPLDEGLGIAADRAGDPAGVVELRDRLTGLARLPERQQRLIWMRGFGFRPAEIAAGTGQSERTVERQLVAARRRLREAEGDTAA